MALSELGGVLGCQLFTPLISVPLSIRQLSLIEELVMRTLFKG